MRTTAASLAIAVAMIHAAATPVSAQGFVAAEGGGNPANGAWAASVFGWMIDRAEASRGLSDVVILGVDGPSLATESRFLGLGADSAANLTVTAATADAPATYAALAGADIVYILGGDQAEYVQAWAGTEVERAIRDLYAAGGVVGGTSAGCAVLGEVVYDAAAGSLTPRQALGDGRHPSASFTTGFFDLVPGVLFDTHFTERGRIGRLPTMLARAEERTGLDLLAIGVDDRTALCVSPGGIAEVRGSGAVTVLEITPASEVRLEGPPTIADIAFTSMVEGYTYDLEERRVLQRPIGAEVPPPGATPQFQQGHVRGFSAADAQNGQWRFSDGGSSFALFDGALTLSEGQNVLGGGVASTRVWDSTDFDENRAGGPQWVIKERPHTIAYLLDSDTTIETEPPAALRVVAPSGEPASMLVLDAFGMASTSQSTYFTDPVFSVGPRQSVAIEGARLHVIAPGLGFDAQAGRVTGLACGPADVDGSGGVTFADVTAFISLFNTSDADVNGDGVTSFADVTAFIQAFNAGCP